MKKILITLFAALLTISAAIALKNQYSYKIPIHNRGISDASKQGKLDLLFLGSSTFRSNIDLLTLEKEYPNNYIISYGGNQYVSCDIQYDEIKERFKEMPKLLILEFDPLILEEEPDLSDSRVIWDLSFTGKLRLWDSLDNHIGDDFHLVYEYFITSGMDDLFTYPITEKIYAGRYYRGAKNSIVESPGIDALTNEEFDLSNKVIIPAQEYALRELIDNCRADGTNFIFIESPHYSRLANDPKYIEHRQYLINIMEDSNVDYILSDYVNFDNNNPNYYEDMSHMSYKGKVAYSEALRPLLNNYFNR